MARVRAGARWEAYQRCSMLTLPTSTCLVKNTARITSSARPCEVDGTPGTTATVYGGIRARPSPSPSPCNHSSQVSASSQQVESTIQIAQVRQNAPRPVVSFTKKKGISYTCVVLLFGIIYDPFEKHIVGKDTGLAACGPVEQAGRVDRVGHDLPCQLAVAYLGQERRVLLWATAAGLARGDRGDRESS